MRGDSRAKTIAIVVVYFLADDRAASIMYESNPVFLMWKLTRVSSL